MYEMFYVKPFFGKEALTNVIRIHSLTIYPESVQVTGHNERQLKEKRTEKKRMRSTEDSTELQKRK
jgi:hypothetical protein